jgi:nucleoside phosphorylase
MNRNKALDFEELATIPPMLSKLAWRLQKRTAPYYRPYHLLLSCGEDNYRTLDGYRAFVRLLRGSYFSTIVITEPSPHFEYALNEHHPRPPTYVIGYGQDDYIANALDGQTDGTRVIKLYSSPHNGQMTRQIARMTPLPIELQQSLERYLSQDIVIVGSIVHNQRIRQALRDRPGGSIYYVLPKYPEPDDPLLRLMMRQGRALDTLLTGTYGELAMFFQTLEELLNADTPYIPNIVDAVPMRALTLIGKDTHYKRPESQLMESSLPYHLVRESTHVLMAPRIAPRPTRQISRTPSGQKRTTADVLLVTVTSIEARAVLEQFPEYREQIIQDKTYYDLGTIEGARIFMVQSSRMGAIGQGAARGTIEKGIQALSPWAVIMVGIAFGFDENKQHIGDILVAQQIVDYESQRVGSGPQDTLKITPRGDRASVSERLLDRFQAGQLSFSALREGEEEAGVSFGLILSGNKLVDNKAFRDQLHMLAPEAIGGEMEGTALLEAAHGKVDWIIVKAICDWADGQKHVQKDERQLLAAENAARFTAHVLRHGGFTRPRRQKRS